MKLFFNSLCLTNTTVCNKSKMHEACITQEIFFQECFIKIVKNVA